MRICTTRQAVACAAFLLFLAQVSAQSFKLGFNVNQWPTEMLDRQSEWAPALAAASGMIGMGAPNPTQRLSTSQQNALISLFAPATTPRFRIHEQTWQKIEPFLAQGLAGKAAYDASIARLLPAMAAPETIKWVYDTTPGTGPLTVAQLDRLRANRFHKVLIISRAWTTPAQEAAFKAAVKHPWCRGVALEGSPASMMGNIPANTRLATIQFVLTQTTKPVFLSVPQGQAGTVHVAPDQVGRYKAMLDNMVRVLGTSLLCNPRFTILPAAYKVETSGVPFFPGLTDPTDPTSYADSYVGSMLYMVDAMKAYCPPPPAP